MTALFFSLRFVEACSLGSPLIRCRRSYKARRIARAAVTAGAIDALWVVTGAHAQEMEPRAYSAAPIGTNFLIAGYARTTGSVAPDPSLPITGVEATINTGILAYNRTFGLFGRQASAAVLLPFVRADVSGDVGEQSRKVSRRGLGDIALRFTTNFIGSPALTPPEFALREPSTTLGASFVVLAPTGDYNPLHLINISSNRWAFRPEIGVSQPIGNWFADGSVGVWTFTDNKNFFGGHRRGEEPIWSFQAHAGYNFRPGLWLAGDITYYVGGETSIDGLPKHDAQANSRYGLTLSVPVAEGFSVKLAWSNWLTTRNGGQFETLAFTLQYRWFDP